MGQKDTRSSIHALIFDTDILVWYLRKDRRAAALVESSPVAERHISLISYLEILRGCRSLKEAQEIRLVVLEAFDEVVPLDEDSSEIAVRLMERTFRPSRPEVLDTLIAATALSRGEALATANRKHFEFYTGIQLKVFRPQ